MKTLVPPPITPGPWTKNIHGDLIGSNGETVVLSNAGIGLGSARFYPQGPANTTLFHAAPAMAEALVLALDALESLAEMYNMTSGDVPDKCRNALLSAGYTEAADPSS